MSRSVPGSHPRHVAGNARIYDGVERRMIGAGTRSIMTLTQAGLPLASARSSAGPSSPAARDQLAVAAERLRHQVVARGQQLAAVRRGSGRTRAAGSGARRSSRHRCRRRPRTAARSARRCRTPPCGTRTCRRPCMATTGASGSAARAAIANGIEAPIEPAGPLMRRRDGASMRLRPLPDLAAVAHQDGTWPRRSSTALQRPAKLHGMHLARLACEASVAQAGGR